jgi:ArgP family transcriptional regulator
MDPQLQAFTAISEQGSVHGAADELFLTQTAVTQRLKGLEGKLGTSLFTRSRRGMLLTSEGEALLRYCQSAKALEGAALAQIKGMGMSTSVRVSLVGPSSLLQTRVLPAVSKVMHDYPQVLFNLIYDDKHEAEQLLKTGKVQFALLPEVQLSKEMQYKRLQAEQYILVASSQWRKRRLADILTQEKIIDFEKSDHVTLNYLKHFELQHDDAIQRHYANHPEAIAQLVADGHGYSVLEERFVKKWLDCGELVKLNRGKVYCNEVCLAWYERPKMPDYLAALVGLFK